MYLQLLFLITYNRQGGDEYGRMVVVDRRGDGRRDVRDWDDRAGFGGPGRKG